MVEFAAICLAANIYFEARNQPEIGQIAVAQVTLNRADYDMNRVCEVTLARKQFSWLNGKTKKDGKDLVILAAFEQPKDKKAWAKSKTIANQVLAKKHKDVVQGATHYHTKEVNPKWNRNLKKVTTIGDHIFYKEANRTFVAVSDVEVEPELKLIETLKTKACNPCASDVLKEKFSIKKKMVFTEGFSIESFLALLTFIPMRRKVFGE